MFRIPVSGTVASIKAHRCRRDIHVDWIESSVVLGATTVSRSDIVDSLIDAAAYEDQNYANEWVDNLFRELDRRIALLGAGSLLRRTGNRVESTGTWQSRPAYAFCLVLTMLPHYRKEVVTALGKKYGEQGELFEELSHESLALQHWQVERVGWSRKTTNTLGSKVDALAAAVGEPSIAGGVKRWSAPQAKDGGLDLVAWQPFPDRRGGRPLVLVQCASGDDWRDKVHTPQIPMWIKLVDFSAEPRRGLSMPFAPEEDDFRRHANLGQVQLLLDRHRLLHPSRSAGVQFPSPTLGAKLNAWIAPRIAVFPTEDN